MEAVLADWRTAPVDERLRATLGFLERVTLRPDETRPGAWHQDVSREDLVDALYVAAYFNLIDRVADALGFDLPPAPYFAEAAPRFLAEGYVRDR